MSKTFLEVFKKYQPVGEKRALLERARDASFRYKREPQLLVEAELYFDAHLWT